jgi:hypothetical protein
MIPYHLDLALREIGVIQSRHATVFIPSQKPAPYVAWKPTPEQKEPPF